MGKALAKYDADAIVCSRKPELLYAMSGMRGVQFIESKDTEKMLQAMIDRKVEYVLLDQMGFASTEYFLLPCLEKHMDLFKLVGSLPNPDTYLFAFDRKKAIKFLNKDNQ